MHKLANNDDHKQKLTIFITHRTHQNTIITSAALGPLLGSYLHLGFSRVLTYRFAVLFRGFPARPPRVLFSRLLFLCPWTSAPPQRPHFTSWIPKLNPVVQ